MNTKSNPNIETRISKRARSIFAAFGTIINDFYLEAGIYFVGGFNAALVAWNIYTSLVIDSQPLPYAIGLAIIAFIAVEGLAVYLVGAAAKTGNGLLWIFSVIFAGFFTVAHYREMSGHGVIAQYITLAIPPFVVIGYWARTVKIDVETERSQRAQRRNSETARLQQIEDEERQRQREIEAHTAQQRDSEAARQRQIEDEERQHQREIEVKQLAHNLEMDRIKSEQEQAQKLARIEAKKVSASVPKTVPKTVSEVSHKKDLETLKDEIINELSQEKPNMSQLARRLDIARGTLYRHIGTLAGRGEVIKNGNGYEVVKGI